MLFYYSNIFLKSQQPKRNKGILGEKYGTTKNVSRETANGDFHQMFHVKQYRRQLQTALGFSITVLVGLSG
jgi:hypothetical protein